MYYYFYLVKKYRALLQKYTVKHTKEYKKKAFISFIITAELQDSRFPILSSTYIAKRVYFP